MHGGNDPKQITDDRLSKLLSRKQDAISDLP